MKTLALPNLCSLTFLSFRQNLILLVKFKSLDVRYFLLSKVKKIQVMKTVVIFEDSNTATIFNLIKNNLINKIKKKLIIRGLGFKVYNTLLINSTIHFKLGLSHYKILYIKNKELEISFYKIKRVSSKINVLIVGNDLNLVTGTAALLKGLLKINVYKNTGIFYKTDKLKLKKVKKK